MAMVPITIIVLFSSLAVRAFLQRDMPESAVSSGRCGPWNRYHQLRQGFRELTPGW